jgi:hypothetical protein
MRSPGLEPGPGPWQGPIIPLDYERTANAVGIGDAHNGIVHNIAYIRQITQKCRYAKNSCSKSMHNKLYIF